MELHSGSLIICAYFLRPEYQDCMLFKAWPGASLSYLGAGHGGGRLEGRKYKTLGAELGTVVSTLSTGVPSSKPRSYLEPRIVSYNAVSPAVQAQGSFPFN